MSIRSKWPSFTAMATCEGWTRRWLGSRRVTDMALSSFR